MLDLRPIQVPGSFCLFLVICISIFKNVSGGIVINDEADKYSEYFKYQAQADISEDDPNYWQRVGLNELKYKLNKPLIKGEAKNVILFMGDGMSLTTITSSRIYKGQSKDRLKTEARGEQAHLAFENFPFTGLAKTYCVDQQTADSACSATAYLTGVKTNLGTIGVSSKITRKNCEGMKNPEYFTTSILKWAQDFGKLTGIITTTRVTHASPAGTYAHTTERDWECDADIKKDPNRLGQGCKDIATQLVKDEPGRRIRVIFGGGRNKFLPESSKDDEGYPGQRTDGVDLIKEWLLDKTNKTRKAKYIHTRGQLMDLDPNNTDYVLGLFSSDNFNYNLEKPDTQPTLAEMTRAAINILSQEKKGYFLFIEGGLIDIAHHNNTAAFALDETVEMSKAVEVAVNMTREKDTLIVVTADHAHTMTMSGYSRRNHNILGNSDQKDQNGQSYPTLSYANGPGARAPVINESTGQCQLTNPTTEEEFGNATYHYPALVPLVDETHGGDDVMVFARGPWSHLFTGSYEQNFIPIAMGFASRVGPNSKAATESSGWSMHQQSVPVITLTVMISVMYNWLH
uniref:alkaline phosphatase n=1 Tax=Cacopsylla melanoneura TaxID=428564 RepID=A0A8D8UST0_9HEMI